MRKLFTPGIFKGTRAQRVCTLILIYNLVPAIHVVIE